MQTSTTEVTGGPVSVFRTVTGLTPGRAYTATVWVNPDTSAGVTDLTLGVAGVGASTPVAPGAGYQQLTYTFTATAASHDLLLGYQATDDSGSRLSWDDITVTQDAWVETTTPASTVQDAVLRSQSGRIVQNTITDTATPAPETSTYGYDTAGRLVTAQIPRHALTYSYASTGGCGVNTAAGKNCNRTGFSDTFDGGTPTTVGYCYDNADRLTSTTVTNAPVGAGPVAGGNLSTAGPGATLAYDTHGNTTVLADQVLGYDVADQHVSTTLPDGTVITYLRDASGQVVKRTVDPLVGPDEVVKFSSGGGVSLTLTSGGVMRRWVRVRWPAET